jgi:hypothetical protein
MCFHSLQLAVSHAADELLPGNLQFIIKETYIWFVHSPVHQTKHNQLFATIHEDHQPLYSAEQHNADAH